MGASGARAASAVSGRQAGARPTRVLFVCLGNICRSPTAEGVMRALVSEAGMEDRVHVDSAGTGAWHVGSPPDRRASEAARARGVELQGHARQVRAEDFEDFDLLLAMDGENARELRRQAPGDAERAKVRLLREFDRASNDGPPTPDLDVPDPYYGAAGGFDEVFELVHAACAGLLDQIVRDLTR
ncbi:MAG TPA: low molecular weight protein-tyrosine-phosphatase [Solirubrobacteraceae bacterium]|nr:low molecular weight protein-tyrosine-phosphatase [Solirubrobacteraceae bacterium]